MTLSSFNVIFVLEIQIELDIFSGAVNPSWTLTSASPEFANVKTSLLGASGSDMFMTGLGYRGFIVKTVFTTSATVTQLFGKGVDSSIETALLNSNGGILSADVLAIAQAGIAGQVS